MFCKSRDEWKNMPGGLIQSVLVEEKFELYDRLDECFYHTVSAIKDRLLIDKEVYNPTDESANLLYKSSDYVKMNNLYTRLNNKLKDLDILFEADCTDYEGLEAWEKFFNHEYWKSQKEKAAQTLESYEFNVSEEEKTYIYYRETEEFIEHMFPINISFEYELNLDCKVVRNAGTVGWLREMFMRHQLIYPASKLYFKATTNVPEPYDVYWKVKNKGQTARLKDLQRGEIIKTNKLTHYEESAFKGEHYVECYIVKNGECILKERIPVIIRL